MKTLRTVRYSLIAAAVAGATLVSTPVSAEVSATAGVASLYLWRGQNLGGGTPVVSGSLDYGHESGLFAGIWGSSAGPDQEVDLYGGYAYSTDDFGVKVTFYDYFYPRTAGATGDLQELVLSVNASGFFADAIIGVGDFEDGNYYDVGYTYDKYTVKYGMTDGEDLTGPNTDYAHLDLAYAFNENLTFTLSGPVDSDALSAVEGIEDPLFVVSYVLPIK